MNRRDALIRAHVVTGLIIRSYLDNAEELAENEADADKMEVALLELAVRHELAASRMNGTDT